MYFRQVLYSLFCTHARSISASQKPLLHRRPRIGLERNNLLARPCCLFAVQSLQVFAIFISPVFKPKDPWLLNQQLTCFERSALFYSFPSLEEEAQALWRLRHLGCINRGPPTQLPTATTISVSMEVHYITINAVDSQPVDVDSLLFNENDTTTDLLRHVEQMRSTSGQRYSPFRIQKVRCGCPPKVGPGLIDTSIAF